MTPVREVTVREYAEIERVKVRTVRRWIAKGAVDVRRTPGGSIRVLLETRGPMTKRDTRGQL